MRRTSGILLALLASVAAAAATPAASSGDRRSSTMVTRNVELPGGGVVTLRVPARRHRAATLLRFPRSRVALVSRSDGRLMLKAGRFHALTRSRQHRAIRVRVRLDVAMSRITARAGRRRLRIERRLRAETHIVHARRLRGVTVTPLGAPRRSGNPRREGGVAPGGSSPAGSGVSGRARLFAADGVWNRPLPDDAALDPAGGTLVRTLRDTVAQTDAWIGAKGSSPLYTVPADQSTVRVQLDDNTQWWRQSLQEAFNAVPIPDAAVPAEGPDAHMTVWQPATDRLWEFFRSRKLADGWHAAWGGAIENVSRSPGYYDADSWPGLSGPHWGATATSLPVIAGTILIDEIRAGVIPHALALSIPWAKPKVYASPAQRSDGRSTDPNAIPEGARFRLDPQLDIAKLNLPPITRMIAEAAQRYGMIVRDQTGNAVGFFAENATQYGTDPYGGSNGLFGGTPPNVLLRAFPWEHLQLLKMQLHTTN